RAPAGLAAERHRLTVEPAERAVHLLAPPAPSRRLEEDARSPAPAEAARSELREVVAVVRVGKRVEVAYHRSGAETAARELRLYAVAGPDAGEAANRPPVEYAARQLGKDQVGLSADGRVDEGELADHLRPHDTFAIGAAE